MLYRPLVTLMVATTLIVCILCILLAVAATRSHERLRMLSGQLELLQEFEESARSVVRMTPDEKPAELEAALGELALSRDLLDEATAAELGFEVDADTPVPWKVRRRDAKDAMLREALAEWWLILILAALLGGGTLLLAWLLRRHVLRPLEVLNELLTRMSLRRHDKVETADINPALRPLFESYNELVQRVHQAQDAQARREAELRQELRQATRALMQQQMTLMRDQRLAANGELTAQLAHDMRNPLAGILAAVENLRRDTGDDDHVARLELIRDEVKRVSRQLDTLVGSSRQRPEPAVKVALCDVAESVLSLASYQLTHTVALGCDIDPELTLTMPEGSFRQALLNLVINAANAIGDDESGRIDVRAHYDAEHVILSVSDTGPGFSQAALETGVRAFASFSPGGSGLGLAAVRRFMNDLGGRIELENLDGGGARVSLFFPEALSDE